MRTNRVSLRKVWVLALALFFALAALQPRAANAVDDQLLSQLSETITTLRTSEPSLARTDAAEHLAELTKKMRTQEVGEQTLADLISLLDTRDESVRFWVATALGNLGPQAKVAIPALKKTLTEVDCFNGPITSAMAIRRTLTRLGATPARQRCVGRISG